MNLRGHETLESWATLCRGDCTKTQFWKGNCTDTEYADPNHIVTVLAAVQQRAEVGLNRSLLSEVPTEKKTYLILRFFKGSFVYKAKEEIILCIYLILLSSQQEQCVRFQALHFTGDAEKLGRVQKRTAK